MKKIALNDDLMSQSCNENDVTLIRKCEFSSMKIQYLTMKVPFFMKVAYL